MKKLESTLPNMLLSLGVITAVVGALLGLMYSVTKEPIARQAAEAQVAAIREVAPVFDNDPEADKTNIEIDGVECTVYPAKSHGKLVGGAVKSTTMNGFSGEVTVMCGFEADGTVRDYRVLQQGETPGLGAKMETWFRDATGNRSVLGKNPATTKFYVTKDVAAGGEIDAITAATISSRAFLETVRSAWNAYMKYAGADVEHEPQATTGASKQKQS
jgi:electron transport complex protein RnfG